jgi:hypothetical protein
MFWNIVFHLLYKPYRAVAEVIPKYKLDLMGVQVRESLGYYELKKDS